ncbi:MAG: M48 family metalloprotease [Gammaproteobacteria bacterium]|nr:M48 family metalloprotease [Gammaproteobacteria bacterium]MCF6229996.1 M48 family metalloprotease [Gammaproteobacteria bacterium]
MPTRLILLLFFSLTAWADGTLTIPDIGNSADSSLSLKEEQRLGGQFMRQMRGTADLLDAPEIEAYIQSLGEQLVSYLDEAPYRYTFFVVNSAQINAFAVPGGYIGINAGLIIAADNESELASVLAHEIAHVSQRHISRAMEGSSGANLATIASILAAIALSSQGGDASLAALSVGMATSQQSRINYTRTHEKEADRIGIQLLAGAHYDPQGMARFFEKLHKESRYYQSGLPEILMTHPVTLNRISDAKNRAAQYSQQGKEGIADKPAFQYFRAKVRVLNSNKQQQLEQQTRTLFNKHPLPELAYQLALLESYNGKAAQAETRLRKLIQQQGEHPWLTVALAGSLQRQQKNSQALTLYKQALLIYPGNKALTLNYAEQLLKQNAADEAFNLLKIYLRTHHQLTPRVHQLYAQAASQLGNRVDASSALAEYFYLRGQSVVAVQHLEEAIKAANNQPYRLPKLKQRRDEIKKVALSEQAKTH